MHKKIKIIIVVTAAHVVPWHLENTLKRMQNEFEVCVVGQGVSMYKDSYPIIKWVDINIYRKLNLLHDFISLISLCRLFISYKPDIVHSIMHKAALLTAVSGFLCQVPVRINTFTSQYWATKSGLARATYYASDWMVNFLNTVCLTDSPSQSDYLYKHKIFSKSGKPLPVLLKGSLSGVDLNRFDWQMLPGLAGGLRKELGLDGSEYIFLFLARKNREKGVFDLINAFVDVSRLYPHARLLFVGPDETNGELEKLIKNKSYLFFHVLNINQSVDNRELYLAISNVLCLPSYKEGFGSIVIDAAAQTVPTIGTNIPGLVDSIQDGETGVLFPVGDIAALTKTMINFLENPNKFAQMGLAARSRVEEYFTADLLYEALKKLYLEMVIKK